MQLKMANIIQISSQIEQPQGHFNYASSSTARTESFIQHLIKIWRHRQKWQQKNLSSSTVHKDMLNNNVAPWRVSLVSLLETPQAHIIAIFLLVLDLALSIFELSSSITPTSCKNNEAKIEAWYHWVGVSILGLLFLKTMLLVVGLGGSFFKTPGYVVDGVVVGVALVLEVVLERIGGGLLVVVSLWRVIRAVESVYELSDDAIEAKITELVSQFDVLREENRRLLETIGQEDRMITKLEEQLDECPRLAAD